MLRIASCLVVMVGASLPAHASGVSARLAFEDAYDNVNNGDWYKDSGNEQAFLAWGESYVMMGLAAMYRGTRDRVYLDRLAHHVDGVLAMRDNARGISDYRGVSGSCWQNTAYQPNDEAYCYVVHSGMIAYPMAELARLVRDDELGAEPSYDGTSYADKAAAYLAAAEATVAAHDDQWNAAGYYIFRADATFLGNAGRDLPLNQSNAMGRLLLVLHDLTGKAPYLDKATKLAQRFKSQLSSAPGGAYRWNYWGGPYSGNGEDISHASINVDFAVMAAAHGVVFDGSDLAAFALTFTDSVYRDDGTFGDWVGGGSANNSSYRPQVGRWLNLTPSSAVVYTAVRDLYEADYPAASIGSGSLLLGWALLAEHEPPLCPHFFYSVDWADNGDWRQATAYGANVLTEPPVLAQRCMIPLNVDVPRAVEVRQWDGGSYHRVATWRPTAGPALRHVPYDPRWPFVYWNNGVLYEFADTFVSGQGIQVREAPAVAYPQITSSPPTTGPVAQDIAYQATGTGDGPLWWSLIEHPTGASIDRGTGLVSFVPDAPGDHNIVVELISDWGSVRQSFTYSVTATTCAECDAGAGTDAGAGADASEGNDAAEPGADGGAGGCCQASRTPSSGDGVLALLLAFALTRTRRRQKLPA